MTLFHADPAGASGALEALVSLVRKGLIRPLG